MTLSQFPTSLSVNGVSQDTEREAFKAWCGTEYGFDLQRDALGDYAHDALVLQWEAWQARAAIAARPPAASLAQAVKAGLAKRFPDDPPMEIAAIQPPAASQPKDSK